MDELKYVVELEISKNPNREFYIFRCLPNLNINIADFQEFVEGFEGWKGNAVVQYNIQGWLHITYKN